MTTVISKYIIKISMDILEYKIKQTGHKSNLTFSLSCLLDIQDILKVNSFLFFIKTSCSDIFFKSLARVPSLEWYSVVFFDNKILKIKKQSCVSLSGCILHVSLEYRYWCTVSLSGCVLHVPVEYRYWCCADGNVMFSLAVWGGRY